MSLLTELDAFFTDHRLGADLDAGVEGEVVWIACDCGGQHGQERTTRSASADSADRYC